MAFFNRKRKNKYIKNSNNTGKHTYSADLSSTDASYMLEIPSIKISRSFMKFVTKGIYKEVEKLRKRSGGSLDPEKAGFLDKLIDKLCDSAVNDIENQYVDRLRLLDTNELELDSYIYRLEREIEELDKEILKLSEEQAFNESNDFNYGLSSSADEEEAGEDEFADDDPDALL